MEQVVLVDDLDGSTKGVEKHTIAIDGELRDIDLTEENMNALRVAVSRFIEAARPRGRSVTSITVPGRVPARVDKEQRDFIREWAKRNPKAVNGIKVADRGKIPDDVLEAFQNYSRSSHSSPPKEEGKELVTPGGRALFSDAARR